MRTYLGRDRHVGRPPSDGALHHSYDFVDVLLDPGVLLVGLQAGSVLVLADLQLFEDYLLSSLVQFGDLCPEDDLKVFFDGFSTCFSIDCFGVAVAGRQHLVLDLPERLLCFFDREWFQL